MLKFAANLSFLFQEHDFQDRFAAAADAGFKGIEYLFPYAWPAIQLKNRLEDQGLHQALFNLSPGDWEKGERGLAGLPGREDDFLGTVKQALEYADTLDCKNLHVMAGLQDPDLEQDEQMKQYQASLTKAVELVKGTDITLLIEPINRQDMPGYLLSDFDEALQILKDIGSDSLRLQFDVYHCQKIHGDVSKRLTDCLPVTRHIQIANPPDRSEPGVGELNFPHLFDLLEQAGYGDWIGCEYKPSVKTVDSLAWAQHYLKRDEII